MRLSLFFAVLGLVACGGPAERDISAKARVVPKGGEVWGRDLARGLGLLEWELCEELGQYDCIGDAHRITLGGVEAERLGVDEPLPNALVSAPIAIDRVAVSACGERLKRDAAGPAVVFGPVLDRASNGRRKDVAETLVRRLLSREPLKEEVEHLVDLYDVLEDVSSDPDRDWAIGACVIVATSTEALFY